MESSIASNAMRRRLVERMHIFGFAPAGTTPVATPIEYALLLRRCRSCRSCLRIHSHSLPKYDRIAERALATCSYRTGPRRVFRTSTNTCSTSIKVQFQLAKAAFWGGDRESFEARKSHMRSSETQESREIWGIELRPKRADCRIESLLGEPEIRLR